VGVDARDQLRRQSACLGKAVVGEHLDVAMRAVGERLGGGARVGSQHVSHGVVGQTLLDEHRGVGGWSGARGLGAVALVDDDVHQHAAWAPAAPVDRRPRGAVRPVIPVF